MASPEGTYAASLAGAVVVTGAALGAGAGAVASAVAGHDGYSSG
jgi:hypothetical protein